MPSLIQAPTISLLSSREIMVIASPEEISEACFAVPAVRAICEANSENAIVVVANEEVAPIWQNIPEVHQVIEHPRSASVRKIANLLKKTTEPIGCSLTWDDTPASRAFAKLAVRQRLGYPAKELQPFLTEPVEVIRQVGPTEHRVNHYLLLVKELGIDPFQAQFFQPIPRRTTAEKNQIVIAPGSDYGSAAEWPLESFVALCQNLQKQAKLAVLATPGRPEPARALAKALGDSSLFQERNGQDLIDFLSQSKAAVTNDSSIAHLASLVGTPSLVFFGPNLSDWKRPLGRIHEIIESHPPCCGCLLNKCPLDHRCMNEIGVDQASARFDQLS